MILEYSIGDIVEWQHRVKREWYDDPTGKWLPAVVIGVHHEGDDVGDYTTVAIRLYDNHTRYLSEPETRAWLRKPCTCKTNDIASHHDTSCPIYVRHFPFFGKKTHCPCGTEFEVGLCPNK